MKVTTAAMIALAFVVLAAPAPRASTVDLQVKPLVDAVTHYVADYETALAAVLGDEITTQAASYPSLVPRPGTDGGQMMPGIVTRHRQTQGELFLTYLPADGAWIAVHDVAEVNEVPVERDDIVTLLARAPLASVARDVANRNARFNLGHITRNFNEPTLALLLFDTKRVNTVKFTHPSASTDADGAAIVTLDFEERESPSIVSSRTDGPVFSKGQIVIEPDTGRIRRTVLKLKHKDVSAELTTTYRPDEHLHLWLPATFQEKYVMNDPHEEDVCESIYRNYRRFEVSVRIK
jgi:hypothetical protein